MNILEEIFANKRREVETRKQLFPLEKLQAQAEGMAPPQDFLGALRQGRQAAGGAGVALIAEVKCASPSRGLLAPGFDPLALAKLYARNGAAAISVLTDERYFLGSLDHLTLIKEGLKDEAYRPPLLRKDFIDDPYQIYEARCAGADAVLLIAAALEPPVLRRLYDLACALGLAPLVEVHNREELEAALGCRPMLIGINHRNLKDFSIDLDLTLRLRPFLPHGVCLVAESGIHTLEDVQRLARAGVDAILVGEALVTAPDIAAQVRAFSGFVSGGL